ncbi:MAG TPA: endonuclease/exonuclease/phosphatase family protein [Chitinophagaceae bacterium]|nr:endonuclease/exonuclease/phosphatase family protein [Chitinophagaceae bacterium]
MRLSFVVFIFAVLFVNAVNAQPLIVGTFNIRYDNPGDTGNLWMNRSPICASLIRFHGFDILGTQEGLKNQLEDLQLQLPEYEYHGIGRDDGQSKGEHSAIFIRKERFKVLGKGDFWLSETPDKPGPGWDARLNRICSWLKLEDKKLKKTYYVFNVHYDHQGIKARVESSKLILQKIKTIAGDNEVILTGDFNGNHESEWYLEIEKSGKMKDVLFQTSNAYRNTGSFNSFKPNNPSKDVIDHIFVTPGFRVQRYGILTDTYHGKYPSDHYPVLAELIL